MIKNRKKQKEQKKITELNDFLNKTSERNEYIYLLSYNFKNVDRKINQTKPKQKNKNKNKTNKTNKKKKTPNSY